jgi:uncharacterized membrane protein YtjA (UPF0391 family)
MRIEIPSPSAIAGEGTKLTLSKEIKMLYWALMFLVIALVAAVLGFGTLAGMAATIAKILFVLFLVLFVVSLLMGSRRPIA